MEKSLKFEGHTFQRKNQQSKLKEDTGTRFSRKNLSKNSPCPREIRKLDNVRRKIKTNLADRLRSIKIQNKTGLTRVAAPNKFRPIKNHHRSRASRPLQTKPRLQGEGNIRGVENRVSWAAARGSSLLLSLPLSSPSFFFFLPSSPSPSPARCAVLRCRRGLAIFGSARLVFDRHCDRRAWRRDAWGTFPISNRVLGCEDRGFRSCACLHRSFSTHSAAANGAILIL